MNNCSGNACGRTTSSKLCLRSFGESLCAPVLPTLERRIATDAVENGKSFIA